MDQEDPLQLFLKSTGWSPDQLLQKLQNIKTTTNEEPCEDKGNEENKETPPEVVEVIQNDEQNATLQCTSSEGSSSTVESKKIFRGIKNVYPTNLLKIKDPNPIKNGVAIPHIDLTDDFDSPVKIVEMRSAEDSNEVEDNTISCAFEKITDDATIADEKNFIEEGIIPSEDEEEYNQGRPLTSNSIIEVVEEEKDCTKDCKKEETARVDATVEEKKEEGEDQDVIVLSDEDDKLEESSNNVDEDTTKEETPQPPVDNEDQQQSSSESNPTEEPNDEIIFKKPLTLPKKDKHDEVKLTEDLHDSLRMQLNSLRTKKKGIFLENMKKPSSAETAKNDENLLNQVEKKQDDLYTQTNALGLVIMDVQGGIDIEDDNKEESSSNNEENSNSKENGEQNSNNKDESSSVVSEIRKIITKQRARIEDKSITNFEFFKNTPQTSDTNATTKTPEKVTENVSADNSLSHLSIEDSPEKNSPFVSNILDEFLNENAKLNISYKVPKLGAEDTLKDNSFEVDNSPLILKKAVDIKEDMKRTEYLKIKPKTLAQKRKLLEKQRMKEEMKRRKMEMENRRLLQEQNRNYILFKGKQIFVTTRSENTSKCVAEVKKQRKIKAKKPSLLAAAQKTSIKYLAGPLSRKERLQVNDNTCWQAEVKNLPKIFLEVTPTAGKPIPSDILRFLPRLKEKMNDNQIAFALSALYDRNKPMSKKELKTFRFALRYQNNQQQIIVKKEKVPTEGGEKIEDLVEEMYKDPEGEDVLKDIMNDLIRYVELKEIESSLIKDDDTCFIAEDTFEANVSTNDVDSTVIKKPTKRKSRVDYELLRLSCKVVNVELEEEEEIDCCKPYCKLGCVCKSLKCDSMISYHCRKVGCMFQCSCPKERTVTYDHTMTLPAGTDILSTDAVYRIEDEAKRDLARVEREFTQTVIHANDKTIVVGLGTRRAAKIRNMKAKQELTKEMFSQNWVVTLEKYDFGDIKPYCIVHHLYDCECGGTAAVPLEDKPSPHTSPKKRRYKSFSSVSDSLTSRPTRTIKKPAKLDFQPGTPYKSARTKPVPAKYFRKWQKMETNRSDTVETATPAEGEDSGSTRSKPKNKRKQIIEIRYDEESSETSNDTVMESNVTATWVSHDQIVFDPDSTRQRQKIPISEIQSNDAQMDSFEHILKRKRTASWVMANMDIAQKKRKMVQNDEGSNVGAQKNNAYWLSYDELGNSNVQSSVSAGPKEEITLSSLLDKKTAVPWGNQDRSLFKFEKPVSKKKKKPTKKKSQNNSSIKLDGAIQRRKKSITSVKTIQPVFEDEIIVDKSNMELLMKMGPRTVADGYARLLPWCSLIRDYQLGVINIWCNKHFPTKLLMNLSTCDSPPPENFTPIASATNPTQIILWICRGRLPRSYDESNVTFILKDTKSHFEICGLCSKNAPEMREAGVKRAEGGNEVVDFVHNDINDGIQVLELKMESYKLQELIEKGLEVVGDTSIDSTKLYMWAALPEVNKTFMWRVIFLKNNFTFLHFKKMKYTIGYGDLVKAGLMAKNKHCTVLLRNYHMKTYYMHKNFGLYFDPLYQDRFFIGPYFICSDSNDIETMITTGNHITQRCESACGQWLIERPYAKKNVESPSEHTIDLTQETDEPEEEIHIVVENSKPTQVLMHNGEKILVMDSTPRAPEEFNRYIVSNIPHFGYIGAFQHSNSQEIDVQWPFENKLLRFQNVKCAVEFLQYRFSHLLVPVPKTFEIQIVILQELDTEKHQPVNSNILNGHYICGDFGYYSFMSLTEEVCKSKVGISKEEILRCFLVRARNMVKERLDYLASTLNVEPTNPEKFDEADYVRILNTATLEINKQKNLKQDLMYEKLKLMKEKRSKAKRVFNMISCLPQEERKKESMKFWNTMKKVKSNDEPIEITDSEDEETPPSSSTSQFPVSPLKSILKPLRSVPLTEGKSVLMRGDSIIQPESQCQLEPTPSSSSTLQSPQQESKQNPNPITLPNSPSNNYVKGVKLVKNSLGKLLLVTDSQFSPPPVNKLTTGTKIMLKNNKILSLLGKKEVTSETPSSETKPEAISKDPEIVDEVLVEAPIELDESEEPLVI